MAIPQEASTELWASRMKEAINSTLQSAYSNWEALEFKVIDRVVLIVKYRIENPQSKGKAREETHSSLAGPSSSLPPSSQESTQTTLFPTQRASSQPDSTASPESTRGSLPTITITGPEGTI